jgi:hypothetical protein
LNKIPQVVLEWYLWSYAPDKIVSDGWTKGISNIILAFGRGINKPQHTVDHTTKY